MGGPPEVGYTAIQANVKLPKSSDLDWINEKGDAAYNFLGLQWRYPVGNRVRFGTLDVGLQSDSIDAHVRGRWYAFAYSRLFNGADQGVYAFRGWPSGGIPGNSSVNLKLEYLIDFDPLMNGDQEGFMLDIVYASINPPTGGTTRAVAFLDINAMTDVDVTGTAVRRVSSIVWKAADNDPRMCDVQWSGTSVGVPGNMHLFGPEDLNVTSPPLIEETSRSARVSNEIPYHSETIDLSCGASVGLVLDRTGSMSQELTAIKAALRA